MSDEPRHADIFKALADPSRRLLLDLLFMRDGRTLGELEGHLPGMTRFGVMKHLKVLAEAGLVTTRKVGREKLHYLNPVPIQQLYERWVSKYTAPWARTLLGLKAALEGEAMTQKPFFIQEIYIRTTPERLWRALTDGALTRQYFFHCRAESDWQSGSPFVFRNPEGEIELRGDVLEAQPPHRLVLTFNAFCTTDVADAGHSVVIWEIEALGDVCRLTLTHTGLDAESRAAVSVRTHWAQVLSGLKTLLETGEALRLPAAV